MSASTSSQDASSEGGSTDQKHSSEVESPDDRAAETATDSVECPSCGRTFSGTYCPDCGEEVGGSLTVGDVAGDAFREMSEIGGGLPATLVGLTIRPGEVLEEYLSGARRQYMSPGRYLVVAVILFLGVTQGLTWLGLQEPLVDSAMISEESTRFMGEVNQLTQSQWYTLVTVFVQAGILGLLFWRIFGEELRRGAEALAVGVFLIAHASMLSAGSKLLLVPSVSLWKGAAVDPSISLSVGTFISFVYPGVAAYRGFGTSWSSLFKGLLGSMWAYIEIAGIGGIGAFWYVFFTSPNLRKTLESGNEVAAFTVVGGLTVVCLLPLLLHAGMEAYYRLR
ncbi:DUF3667 domain-containing protein [Salinibacter grassmerensis]|uniref:DUF3667 domain-containing protein n=1 Tax=Salinibacter grassmerensis TaxID=3040353 RepID=UPI0021E77B11|nr:DUF3667 domain-containing protein [Salinibacter grassmerensis]